MISLGTHNNREVFYLAYGADKPWADALPADGWMLMITGKNPGAKKMGLIAKKPWSITRCLFIAAGRNQR